MTPHLQKKLASWVEHGLITEDQAERIQAHESKAPQRPWAVYGVAGVGVTSLVTGVISLVAANWEVIPAWFKLGAYFLIQGGVGVAFYRYHQRSGPLRETLLTTFAALFLAGIGLIAQLYNLRGDGWQALLLWATITLPAVWLARNWALVHVWIGLTLASSVIWAGSSNDGIPGFGRYCMIAAIPMLFVGVAAMGKRLVQFNPFVRQALFNWGMGLTLFLFTPLANMMWGSSADEHRSDLGYLAVPWATLLFAVAALWTLEDEKREVRLTSVGLLVSVGVFATLPLLFANGTVSAGVSLVGALGFFCSWGLAAAAAACSQRRRWFDLASFIIAVRVVFVYFEVFGSLAVTGLGLIASGAVTLGTAFAWHRFRERVRQQLGSDL
jgi:uncharacterized membrane protein